MFFISSLMLGVMRVRFIFLLVGLVFSVSAFSEDKVVMQHGATTILQSDIVSAVQSFVPPDKVLAVFSDEKKVRDTVARLFIHRKLAEDAAARTLSIEELKIVEQARLRALAQIQIEYIVGLRPVPDFESIAQESYKAQRESHKKPERVHVEHILISTKNRSEKAALERVEEVFSILQEGARSFADVANQYSDDPSVSKNSGDLGYFGRGSMVKPFEDAAFKMSVKGEISKAVKTDFGFHIIRYVEREAEAYLPFDSVKDRLVNDAKAKFRTKILDEEFDRIGKLSDIRVSQDAINEMINRPFGNGSKK